MIYKTFSFPSAPEVGRIIDTSQSASTVNFRNLLFTSSTPGKQGKSLCKDDFPFGEFTGWGTQTATLHDWRVAASAG
ncbi:hypothetical protein F4W70_18595 [Pseudomonas cannabina]|nr:hypothetical protein F4W70_18595 [Pseudomonas cannabina]